MLETRSRPESGLAGDLFMGLQQTVKCTQVAYLAGSRAEIGKGDKTVFSIVQSVRPGPRTGLRKIHAVRPISGLDGARPEHP